jgi:hypothetical protein
MLKVLFGKTGEDVITYPDDYFNHTFRKEWLNDDFVKGIIKEIDNSDVLSVECIMSPVLGQIPPTKLSGGAKTLILLYKNSKEDFDGLMIDLISIGDNCTDLLLKIGRMKDIEVVMTGFDLSFRHRDLEAFCLNNNTLMISWRDWSRNAIKYINRGSSYEG